MFGPVGWLADNWGRFFSQSDSDVAC